MTLVTLLSSIFYLSNGSLDAFHRVVHGPRSMVTSNSLSYAGSKVLRISQNVGISVCVALSVACVLGMCSVDMILG